MRDTHRTYLRGRVRELRTSDAHSAIKDELVKYKGGKCQVCGVSNLPGVCYDFDHLVPEDKHWNVSYLISINASIEDLKREVDKCDLICANCHRIRTADSLAVKKKISKTVRWSNEKKRLIVEDAMGHIASTF